MSTVNNMVEEIREQVAAELDLLHTIEADKSAATARSNGQEAFVARYRVAGQVVASLNRNKELLKGEKKVNDKLASGLGIETKTLSNFKRVSDLDEGQAIASFNLLGLQGTIDTCKEFHFLSPAAVNAACQAVSREVEEQAGKPHGQPKQAANRHLLKVCDDVLKEDLSRPLPEVVQESFALILNDPKSIETEYTKPSIDWKSECLAAQKKVAELEEQVAAHAEEIATLRATLLEVGEQVEQVEVEAAA